MNAKYAAVKRWRAANPDKVAAQLAKWRSKNPDKYAATFKRCRAKKMSVLGPDAVRAKEAAYARKRRAADPEAQRARMRRFNAKRAAQMVALAGRHPPAECELCHEPPSAWAHGKLVFDHCHSTGAFRGWLCDRCNRTLGQVGDSTDLLRLMIIYLEKFNGETTR